MDITFNCPKCGQSMVINETGVGSLINCPHCSEAIEVPSKTLGGKPLKRLGHPIVNPPPSTTATVKKNRPNRFAAFLGATVGVVFLHTEFIILQ
jgi:DNA-directed RNA polymerase subunit RPC12/RpoP